MRLIDLTNQTFGDWTVLYFEGCRHCTAFWKCCCVCGNERSIDGNGLRSQKTLGCGCRKGERISQKITTHGHTRTYKHSVEYRAWCHMRERCYRQKNISYKNYGGRGITVCNEWRTDFSRFLADMGLRPSTDHSLHRIDNDGQYCPANCKWATKAEQANNKQNSQKLTWNNETHAIAEWARILHIGVTTIAWRMKHGWTPTEILTTPILNIKSIRAAHQLV